MIIWACPLRNKMSEYDGSILFVGVGLSPLALLFVRHKKGAQTPDCYQEAQSLTRQFGKIFLIMYFRFFLVQLGFDDRIQEHGDQNNEHTYVKTPGKFGILIIK
jgi:hypothetical protein